MSRVIWCGQEGRQGEERSIQCAIHATCVVQSSQTGKKKLDMGGIEPSSSPRIVVAITKMRLTHLEMYGTVRTERSTDELHTRNPVRVTSYLRKFTTFMIGFFGLI